MTYDHDLEINRPWYYSTYLVDDEVKVEFTKYSGGNTKLAGVHVHLFNSFLEMCNFQK